MADEGEIIPARVLRNRFRRMAVAQVLLVAAVTFALYLVQQQQNEADAQRTALRVSTCHQAIHGTAGDLIFTDVLIAAAQSNGDQTPVQERRTETFRKAIDDRLLSVLPSSCRGVMGLREFRERVNLEARPPPATGGVSLGP